jgi:hypothetical protein
VKNWRNYLIVVLLAIVFSLSIYYLSRHETDVSANSQMPDTKTQLPAAFKANSERNSFNSGSKPSKKSREINLLSDESSNKKSSTSRAPKKAYVGSSGSLSSSLMSDFNLTSDQFSKMQGAMSSYWGETASWAAKNIFYDESASAASPDGANIYRLPAMDPTEKQRLEKSLGRELIEHSRFIRD